MLIDDSLTNWAEILRKELAKYAKEIKLNTVYPDE